MLIDRKLAAKLGQETVRILNEGHYQTTSGLVVDIREALNQAIGGTISYPPDVALPAPTPVLSQTEIEVRNETTLRAVERLVSMGLPVAALNFASATNPGGGFLGGARAQEESLARSSGLYACIANNPMYDFHRARHDPLYTDHVIYSPNVPVIRTDDGALLARPYLCSFLTSPAVNAKVVLKRDPGQQSKIRQTMASRIGRVLTIAALHNNKGLILGAWGCGAFGNNTNEIADLFHEALKVRYKGLFSHIVFAITDWSDERRFIGPFQRVFGQEAPRR